MKFYSFFQVLLYLFFFFLQIHLGNLGHLDGEKLFISNFSPRICYFYNWLLSFFPNIRHFLSFYFLLLYFSNFLPSLTGFNYQFHLISSLKFKYPDFLGHRHLTFHHSQQYSIYFFSFATSFLEMNLNLHYSHFHLMNANYSGFYYLCWSWFVDNSLLLHFY